MASTSGTTSKKVKKQQTFKEEYHRKWEFITSSKRSENYVRCTLCSDFSIGHGGAYDIQAHIKSIKRRSAAEAIESNRGCNIVNFFPPKDNAVIRAEVLMTQFLIEHNVPFSASDHLSSLVKAQYQELNYIIDCA